MTPSYITQETTIWKKVDILGLQPRRHKLTVTTRWKEFDILGLHPRRLKFAGNYT